MSAPPGYRDHDDSAAKALDAAHAQNDALRQENSRLRAVVEKLCHHAGNMCATAESGHSYDSLRINTDHWEVLDNLVASCESALQGRDDHIRRHIKEAT